MSYSFLLLARLQNNKLSLWYWLYCSIEHLIVFHFWIKTLQCLPIWATSKYVLKLNTYRMKVFFYVFYCMIFAIRLLQFFAINAFVFQLIENGRVVITNYYSNFKTLLEHMVKTFHQYGWFYCPSRPIKISETFMVLLFSIFAIVVAFDTKGVFCAAVQNLLRFLPNNYCGTGFWSVPENNWLNK